MPVLEPLGGSSAAHSFAYWGERQEWLLALSQHRDSDALERSNWDVIKDDLIARFGDDVAIETFSNWLVGWTEHLLVRPGTPAAAAAEEWRARLADYPVADEEAYGMLEFDEEWCDRCDSGTREQHDADAGPIRTCKFRSETDADEIKYAWRHRRENR